MSSQPVGATGSQWRAPVAIGAASAAIITLIATSVLAVLVTQGRIALPSSLSVNHILMGGVGVGVLFSLVSLAVKYCRSPFPKHSEGAGAAPNRAGNGQGPEWNTGARGAAGTGSMSSQSTGGRTSLLDDKK